MGARVEMKIKTRKGKLLTYRCFSPGKHRESNSREDRSLIAGDIAYRLLLGSRVRSIDNRDYRRDKVPCTFPAIWKFAPACLTCDVFIVSAASRETRSLARGGSVG